MVVDVCFLWGMIEGDVGVYDGVILKKIEAEEMVVGF